MRGVLIEGGVGTAYPEPALADARGAAVEPDGLDEGRVDLRELPTVTVDPPTARDFDDAISSPRGRGTRLYVHIADVAFHVRPGQRSTARRSARALGVRPGRVEPMLPPQLSNGVCSLKEGRDRRAVTVEVTFDAALPPGRAALPAHADPLGCPPRLHARRTRSSRALARRAAPASWRRSGWRTACRPSSGAGVSPGARSRSSRSSSCSSSPAVVSRRHVAMPSPGRTR